MATGASARTMPNAARSMPSSSRPASRVAETSRSIISRRTATITTRERGPAGVCTTPSDWKSTTASSIGIGMWSGASTWTAAARPLGSSITGRSSERTTIRWLAMPRRTRGEVVGREELAQRLGQGDGVGGLAVAQDAGTQCDDRALLDGHAAVDVDLGGGDVAGVEVEPDDGGGALLLLEHVSPIGTAPGSLKGCQLPALSSRQVFCTRPTVP